MEVSHFVLLKTVLFLFVLSASGCRVMLCGGWFQITRLSLVV